MTWLRGRIKRFHPPSDKKKAERVKRYRKIQTSKGQTFGDMHFFKVSQAIQAGYAEARLDEGCEIYFEPIVRDGKKQVARFKPPEGRTRRRGNSATFHNPYHFVPLRPPRPDTLEPVDGVLSGFGHDRFVSHRSEPDSEELRYSGRFLCRLSTEGPLVVGADQKRVEGDEKRETDVEPFELPVPGPDGRLESRPAIPGSTLRGLISSLVEAASNSSLRVLNDRQYSRREDVYGARSAVGILVRGEDGELRLRPLTWSYQEMNPTSGSKGSFSRYRYRGILNSYEDDQGVLQAKRFLSKPITSWSTTHQEYWYVDLGSGRPRHHISHGKTIGFKLEKDPISQEEFEKLPESEKSTYVRGMLFLLGIEGSKAHNMNRKKHELFIPDKEGLERNPLPIDPRALEEFKLLLEESKAMTRGGNFDDYPYLPRGRERILEARENDLVFYQTNFEDSCSGTVTRLSFSSIWRRSVPGTLFGSIVPTSPDLIPFPGADSKPGRTQLTLAERMFGFVEDKGQRGLAGRVRFSHALVDGPRPDGDWYLKKTLLKVLASPKPPSPAFYFGPERRAQRNHFEFMGKRRAEKSEFDLEKHHPQGRKMYLHHLPGDLDYETGKQNDRRHLKLRVRPVRRKTSFLFHVDFVNLTEQELSYLRLALRPFDSFRHKLGLGKPLGLGTVRIDPLALFFQDRGAGYRREGLFGPKYAAVDCPVEEPGWTPRTDFLSHRYREEITPLAEATSCKGFPTMRALLGAAHERMDFEVKNALEVLGDPSRIQAPVHYPLTPDQDGEGEHFKWFVGNEDRKKKRFRQRLEPIGHNRSVPTLRRRHR